MNQTSFPLIPLQISGIGSAIAMAVVVVFLSLNGGSSLDYKIGMLPSLLNATFGLSFYGCNASNNVKSEGLGRDFDHT